MQENNPDLTDLLANESFLRYCKRSSDEDVKFWEDYMIAHPGQQELIQNAKDNFILLFNTLAEADMKEQEVRLKSRLSGMATVISMDENNGTRVRWNIAFFIKLVSAAAIAGLIIASGLYYFSSNREKTVKTYVTTYGERKNIQLPDGSVVNLNAGSQITIKESFDQSSRDVYLTGEAFFDVKHNSQKPFIVHTADMDVKALGTAFNVKAYSEEKLTQTSLIRGIVEITLNKDKNKVLLYPSEKITWKDNETVSTDVDRGPARNSHPTKIVPEKIKITEQGDIKEIAWKDNKLVFDNDTLDEIAHMIERWYGVRILFTSEEIRSYRFTGSFEREDLKTLLEYLKESRPFNFKIDNGDNLTVYLSI